MQGTPKQIESGKLLAAEGALALAVGAAVGAHLLDDRIAYVLDATVLDVSLPYPVLALWWAVACAVLAWSAAWGRPGGASDGVALLAVALGAGYLLLAAAGDGLGALLNTPTHLCAPGEQQISGFYGGTTCYPDGLPTAQFHGDLLQLPLHLGGLVALAVAAALVASRQPRGTRKGQAGAATAARP